MSDVFFTGIAPRSDAGKEIYFYSQDSWLVLHDCICRLLDPPIPVFFSADQDSIEPLAVALRQAIDEGTCRIALRDAVDAAWADMDEQEDCPRTDADRNSRLDHYMELMERYVAFLENCGGCRLG